MGRLLERDEQLREIAALARRVGRDPGRVVLLRGEAGVGKTALIGELVAGTGPAIRVLQGWCDPLATPRPLGPLVDALAGLDRRVAQGLVDALDAGDTGGVYRRLLEVLRSGPRWLWVIEDVHWADGATLDLLRFLGRRIAGLPLLLVMTYRDDEVGPHHPLTAAIGDVATSAAITRIGLDALSVRAVGELVAGSGLNAADLHQLTGGNPFYVTEILASGDGRAPGDRLPRSVAEAVWGRLSALSQAGRDTAYAVAVCGPRAESVLVEQVCPSASVGLGECVRAGVLVTEDGVVGFRHELARRAALDQIPHHQRRLLHKGAMEALAEPPLEQDTLAALAFHADQAGDDDAAVRYGDAGARRATALGANREAAELYALVLRRAGDASTEQKVGWLEAQAFAVYLYGEADRAAQLWREVIEIRRAMGDRLGEGDGLRLLSHMVWAALGHTVEAIDSARSAVLLLRDLGPTAQLASALAHMVHISAVTFDPKCAEYAQEAIELGTAIAEPGVVMRARCFAALASVQVDGTGWEQCEEAWHAALAEKDMAEHLGLVGAGMCWTAALHHELDRLRRYIDDMTTVCADIELGAYHLMALGTDAIIALYQGDWATAITNAEDVLTRPGLALINRILPATAEALARARRGEKATGPALDPPAVDAGPGDFFLFGPAWAARAEIAWLAGDDQRAVSEATRALAAAGARTDPWLAGRAQRWLHLAGVTVTVDSTLPRTPYQLEIRGEWHAAAAEWERLGCPYDAAIAQLSGDLAALRSALATFRRLGARPAARRAQLRLTELGGPGTRGRAHHSKTDPLGLTQRQRQVANLLAAGNSDAAIATTLHLSVRTVGHHVDAIRIKLGAANRIQAAHILNSRPAASD